jgi:hypothetical protein
MNKQVKQLVELANRCSIIAKENQLKLNNRTIFNNEEVEIGIYCGADYGTSSTWFRIKSDYWKSVEVSLYSKKIDMNYTLTLGEIKTLITNCTLFIDSNLGIDTKKLAEENKARIANQITELENELNNLKGL